VLDVGLERKIVQKSGSYFSHGDERLGQGRQNATAFLREHPDVTQDILRAIQLQLGEGAVVSSRLLPAAENGSAPVAAAPETEIDADAEVAADAEAEPAAAGAKASGR
jgi:recombination protein RecA